MTTSLFIILFFITCALALAISLIPADKHGRLVSYAGVTASLFLILAGIASLTSNTQFHCTLWTIPELSTLTLHLDGLSALLFIVTGLVLLPAAIFAGGELTRSPEGKIFPSLFFALFASIALLFLAGDILLFLFAWEAMSILCYLLIVTAKHNSGKSIASGYLFLAMGEAGTLAVAIAFLLLATTAGSFDFTVIKAAVPRLGTGMRWTIFLLTFFGFGIKAGLVPVNFWLPRAYVVSSRAFIPVLAGVTLNLGMYGIWRVNADIMPATTAGPGLVVLVIGTISALLGILYAAIENDLKLILAHSSIENLGIVTIGFGAGMVFIATHHPAAASIAFIASLYHLINHSFYKTLLFIGSGVVERETGTRDLDQLGGLIRFMPLTTAAFLVGIMAISALPPFNGFVSEWLTMQTILRSVELSSVPVKLVFVLCGAGFALTVALAAMCFVKLFAMGFLGMRRLPQQITVRDAEPLTLAPMAILAALCLFSGILPTYVIPILNPATTPAAGTIASTALVPPFFNDSSEHATLPTAFVKDFHAIGAQIGEKVLPGNGLIVMHRGGTNNPVIFAMSTFWLLIVIVLLLLLTYVVIKFFTRHRKLTKGLCWSGGIRRLLPEMSYTATGFSNPIRVIFDTVFRPVTSKNSRETVAMHFRTAIRRKQERIHPVDKLFFLPIKNLMMRCALLLARMHHGRFNAYATYTLITLVVVLSVFLLFRS